MAAQCKVEQEYEIVDAEGEETVEKGVNVDADGMGGELGAAILQLPTRQEGPSDQSTMAAVRPKEGKKAGAR